MAIDKEERIRRLEGLYGQYENCDKCPAMCDLRTQVTFGAGNTDADLMIIGNAPGSAEDIAGEPFVGKSGQILNQALYEAGITDRKAEVYITNTTLCRPCNIETDRKDMEVKVDREPSKIEQENCRERLYEEIYVVDPKVIILLGGVPLNLISKNISVTRAIQEQPFYLSIPGKTPGTTLDYFTMVTYHPAYLLHGKNERKPGSEAEEFHRRFQLAAQIIEASKHMSTEVLNG